MAAEPGDASAAARARGCSTGCCRMRRHCTLDAAGRRLAVAVDRGGMSARAARTIADLAGEERVTPLALAEALQYRSYQVWRFARAPTLRTGRRCRRSRGG